MKIEVEVLSQEMIKPSVPTPDHLRNYQLSFLDQIQPPIFMPLVMFYPEEHDGVSNLERCNRIKRALSEALSVYYPLAGRIKDNAFINCNDEGVLFVEAKASCHLSDILEDPNPNNNNKFIPLELDDANELPAIAQVTYLECGGLVVFLGMSHKVGDALSFFTVIDCWAAFARGDTDIISPKFDSATIFPPRDISGFQPRTGITKDNLVNRRFVFDAPTIAAIRDMFTDKNSIDARRPTRVEALSAFIWSRFMAATQEKVDQGKIYTVIHAMNLRTRMDPPLPNHHFGNISRPAIAVPSMDKKDEFYDILNQMREAIRNVNAEYVKQLQSTDGHLNFIKSRAASFMKGEVVTFSFTSLCRLPVYVADFGWGKPVWLGSASLTFKNLCSLFDTKYGDGIEAWINLKQEDMAKLEADKEFLSYVSSTSKVKISDF
ncbi:vinorine synthase-like [Durio zibethinus]|uniref:Vinorine synthase-like n=1 Tax=Durio zibethinus TaxID=66656 RepID=A0A6P5XEM8_DURZI|nr:vinorine synthase-like [Durio zibethinus]